MLLVALYVTKLMLKVCGTDEYGTATETKVSCRNHIIIAKLTGRHWRRAYRHLTCVRDSGSYIPRSMSQSAVDYGTRRKADVVAGSSSVLINGDELRQKSIPSKLPSMWILT
jgi:hypothetical protein